MPPALHGQQLVADGVHAAVHPVKPTALQAAIDGALAQAEDAQLIATDHAVLVPRQRRDRLVRFHTGKVPPPGVGYCAFAGHTRRLPLCPQQQGYGRYTGAKAELTAE